MPLDDLNMMANPPVSPADVEKANEADLSRRSREAEADIDKAAAGETMPPPKDPKDARIEFRRG